MRCCTRAEPTLWATTMDGWLITKLGRDWTRVGKPIPWPYSFTPFNRFWLGEATSLVAICWFTHMQHVRIVALGEPQQQRQQQQQRSARSAPEAAKSRAAQMRSQGAPASDRHRAAAFAQRSRGGRERRPLAYERLAYEKAGARGVRVSMPMV